jgi:cytochrome c-type biogenesis protein
MLMTLDVNVGGAILAGLLSFLSPCILPLVPPYLCFLAGASLNELAGSNGARAVTPRAQTVSRAIAFVLGFGAVFVLLGASASLLGELVADHLTALTRLAGLAIVVFGLHFLGVFRITVLYREARFQVANRPAGLIGAFAVGLAFAFGWTPCVGPVLASILFLAGAEDTAGSGALLLTAYAAGIGIPFLLAAAFVPSFMAFLSRFRRHLGKVEKAMGSMLVVTGALVLSGSMSWIAAWLLETFPALGQVG